MEAIISVQDAMVELKVNRASFYTRCKKSGVKPVRQGRRSFITQEELECLAFVCMESVRQTSGSDRQQTDSRQTADTLDKSSSGDVRLIEALNSEIIHLKTMLSEERDDHRKEKAEVVKERENYQKMLMFLQQDNQHLRQQLLEVPKHSKFDVDSAADVEDSVDISTPASAASAAQPMEYTPRSTSSWGLGIGLGAVAAAIIFYVLTSDQGARFFPNIQQKLVGALHLSDTNSIVPYRFDEGGGLR
ncbi:MAG: hypothetical protein CL913_09465 [Deltaproteobacteria bacterium]|nr:hypothetical protein [Deltaproteobacteria bacterium]